MSANKPIDTHMTLTKMRTGLRPYSATVLALGGMVLMILGLYFVFLRPPLLPEDPRFMGTSMAQVQMSVPQDPRLSQWAARIQKKVDQLWNPPTGIDVAGKVKTVVNFKVSRDGTIVSAEVSQSSGNSSLDELALMTIKRLETVPPIPENFPNDELEVGCDLIYQGQ